MSTMIPEKLYLNTTQKEIISKLKQKNMQHSTKSEQEEQSNGQSTTPETPKLEYFNEEIRGAAPLRVIGNEEAGYTICFGKYRVAEVKESKIEAEEQIYEEPWKITINLIASVLENLIDKRIDEIIAKQIAKKEKK